MPARRSAAARMTHEPDRSTQPQQGRIEGTAAATTCTTAIEGTDDPQPHTLQVRTADRGIPRGPARDTSGDRLPREPHRAAAGGEIPSGRPTTSRRSAQVPHRTHRGTDRLGQQVETDHHIEQPTPPNALGCPQPRRPQQDDRRARPTATGARRGSRGPHRADPRATTYHRVSRGSKARRSIDSALSQRSFAHARSS
jgi:hypothetical protein